MSCHIINHYNNKKKVQFYNEIIKKLIFIGYYNTIDEAIDIINKIEIDFYKKHTELLPKGVIISKKLFVLKSRSFNMGSKITLRQLASAKTITEIKKLRTKVIKSILEI